MTAFLCFDIETIPDIVGLRALEPADESLDDAAVAEQAFAGRREKTGSDFLPLYLHRVAAISVLLRAGDKELSLYTLGDPGDDERTLVQSFYRLIDEHTPQLVSWNGGGFDLQVLHYRALVNGVYAERYWEQGEHDREFRFDNYLNRYHSRHLDLMDVLALYTARANAPLDALAKLCGFPGKQGMDGSQVWSAWQQGRIADIRAYCETDVANTWLMFCRFQTMRGAWSPKRYEEEVERLRAFASAQAPKAIHWQEFLQGWDASQRFYRLRRTDAGGSNTRS